MRPLFLKFINSFVNMIVEKNKVISLQYVLREQGKPEIVEQTNAENPLVFLYGVGGMIPTFEANLAGLKVGDSFDFNIDSNEAYGEIRADHVVEIPITQFLSDGKIDSNVVYKGNTLPMRLDNGGIIYGTITNVGIEKVTMDFNHPMAGKDLHFRGEISDIRDATESEIAHGHVHHGGDHHHH